MDRSPGALELLNRLLEESPEKIMDSLRQLSQAHGVEVVMICDYCHHPVLHLLNVRSFCPPSKNAAVPALVRSHLNNSSMQLRQVHGQAELAVCCKQCGMQHGWLGYRDGVHIRLGCLSFSRRLTAGGCCKAP